MQSFSELALGLAEPEARHVYHARLDRSANSWEPSRANRARLRLTLTLWTEAFVLQNALQAHILMKQALGVYCVPTTPTSPPVASLSAYLVQPILVAMVQAVPPEVRAGVGAKIPRCLISSVQVHAWSVRLATPFRPITRAVRWL